ncbi:hypothetical protein ASC89_12785 [Devosia sp. Root413D1]|uniref:NAD-dependent epimerase/dehydratase family protein n=1 Tax=Devosia sp. Root413D1 TaxID=1736531 RepID=UPI0006FFBD0F|nr:NAD-dependent epimerase/dehydratase family protein [Devosia sp. Root413D1]KQW79170.1 hypothetical protein ASC89_12785 [Devosia sp. Root413D1]
MMINADRTTPEKGRILLTGGTGFVGRHVLRALLAEGESVTLAVRRPGGGAENVKHADLRVIVSGDLETADLAQLFEGVDRVVHLAGLAHVSSPENADLERAFFLANEHATGRLTSMARSSSVRAFINLSSLAAITSNTTSEIVSDSSDERPVTAYGRSKLAAEAHVARLAEEQGVVAISLRPPLVIGADAGGNWSLLQRLAATGWPLPVSSLRARRSFVGVGTLSEAIVRLCAGPFPRKASGAYCVADPDAMCLPEVVTALRAGMGLAARLYPMPKVTFDLVGALTGRQRQIASLTGPLRVDASRFLSTFDFKPSAPLADAISLAGRDYMTARGPKRAS